MRIEEQRRVVRGLLDHLDNHTNVDAGGQLRTPVADYTDPDRAKAEWAAFFQDYPHAIGLTDDLPEPGSFVTINDLGKPILCTRDQAGVFRAFLNVCRHRGTVVEAEERGAKRLFSCPFHSWGYNLEGELVAVPHEDHFGAVDRSCHGLVRLPAEEKYGVLWVHPNPSGVIDLPEQLGGLADELDSWQLDRFRYQGTTRFDHAMNWKLAIDTFGETYHFNALHRDTLAQSFYGNVQMYDTYERNHRMMLCLKNIDTLRGRPEEEWRVLYASLPVYYLFPNVQLIVGAGGPTLVRIYPDAENPNQSHSQVSFYLNPAILELELTEESKAQAQDVRARMQGFANVIEAEDYVAAASSHVGALSGAQEFVLFGRNEPALHHYHNTYRQALGLAPLERI